MTTYGIVIIVIGIMLIACGIALVTIGSGQRSYPPGTILHHAALSGDTWTFVDRHGSISSRKCKSRAEVEAALKWHRDFMAEWDSGGRQKQEAQTKLESAPGYWEKE